MQNCSGRESEAADSRENFKILKRLFFGIRILKTETEKQMSQENSVFLPSPPYKALQTSADSARFNSTQVALRVDQNRMDQFKQQPVIQPPRIFASSAEKHAFAFSACFSSAPDCTGQLALVSVECRSATDDVLSFDIKVYPTEGRLVNLSSQSPVSLSVTVLPTIASATTNERIHVCNFVVDIEPPSVPGEVKSETAFTTTMQIMPEISPTHGVRRPRGRPPGSSSKRTQHDSSGEQSDSPSASPKKRKRDENAAAASNTASPVVTSAAASVIEAVASTSTSASAPPRPLPLPPPPPMKNFFATPVLPESEAEKAKKQRMADAMAPPPFDESPLTTVPRPIICGMHIRFADVEQIYNMRRMRLQEKQQRKQRSEHEQRKLPQPQPLLPVN